MPRFFALLSNTILLCATATVALDGIAISVKIPSPNERNFGAMWRYNIKGSVASPGTRLFAGDARIPCINSTGDSIAIQEKDGTRTWISIISVNGGTPRRVIENSVPMFFMDWPGGDCIYYTKGYPSSNSGSGRTGLAESKAVFKVNVKTGVSSSAVTFQSLVRADGMSENLTACWHWQMSSDARRMVITTEPWHPGNYDFSANDGIIRNCQSGCSYGCSPSGLYTTNNLNANGGLEGHQSMYVRAWDGSVVKYIAINQTAGMGDHFTWQHFGANSDDWIIIPYTYDDLNNYAAYGINMVLYNWRNDSLVRVTGNPRNTNLSTVRVDWPADLWVGDPNSKSSTVADRRVCGRTAGREGVNGLSDVEIVRLDGKVIHRGATGEAIRRLDGRDLNIGKGVFVISDKSTTKGRFALRRVAW